MTTFASDASKCKWKHPPSTCPTLSRGLRASKLKDHRLGLDRNPRGAL